MNTELGSRLFILRSAVSTATKIGVLARRAPVPRTDVARWE
jgi:hypothetical protein